MSQNLGYNACNVDVKFKNKKEMDKRISAFVKEVDKWDECCDYVDLEAYVGALVERDDSELKAHIYIDDDSSCNYDIDKLAELICKHFPTANGTIGWASVDLRHGSCTYADGGSIEIRDGKEAPSYEQQYYDDLQEALWYISEVVGHGDITECGVAHLFKKYCPKEYKEALKNKRGK